jgi:hypothetical protein
VSDLEIDEVEICIDAWIIQDGNYDDFHLGEKLKCAFEFYGDLSLARYRTRRDPWPLQRLRCSQAHEDEKTGSSVRYKRLSPSCGSSALPPKPASRKGPVWGAIVVLPVSWMAEYSQSGQRSELQLRGGVRLDSRALLIYPKDFDQARPLRTSIKNAWQNIWNNLRMAFTFE